MGREAAEMGDLACDRHLLPVELLHVMIVDLITLSGLVSLS